MTEILSTRPQRGRFWKEALLGLILMDEQRQCSREREVLPKVTFRFRDWMKVPELCVVGVTGEAGTGARRAREATQPRRHKRGATITLEQWAPWE